MVKQLPALLLALFGCMGSYAQNCSGAPEGGTAMSNMVSACAADTIRLNIINCTTGAGLSFQWQQSSDSIVWQDITGSTTDTCYLLQNVSTYYRRITSCGDSVAMSTPVLVSMKPTLQCYCKPASSICYQNDLIKKVVIGTLSNSSTCSTNGYINYAGTVDAPDLSLSTVFPVAVTVGPGGTEFVSAWIDYNQDGVFDSDEYTYIGVGNDVTISNGIHIPDNIPLGVTMMRVRVSYNLLLGAGDACKTVTHGETEDYAVRITPAPLCNSEPAGGLTQASDEKVCSTDSVTLSVTGASTGFSGLSYQWQYSTDSTNWNDITGDSSINLHLMQAVNTYYRRVTACGSLLGYSTPLLVQMREPNLCYCHPPSSQCNTTATITNLQFSNLRQASNCSPLGYGNYIDGVATPVQPGTTLPISISVASINNTLVNYLAVWIDYNRNGIFEPDEFTNLGSVVGNGVMNANISIPANASLGTTGMRIRSKYSNTPAPANAADACADFPVSETEDYLLLIDNNCHSNVWTGLGGDDAWENAANWSCGEVPGETANVVINNATVSIHSNPVIYSLLLNPQANLQIAETFNLTILH